MRMKLSSVIFGIPAQALGASRTHTTPGAAGDKQAAGSFEQGSAFN